MDAGTIAFTAGGKWLTAPLSSSLEVQPGDTIEVHNGTVWLNRGGYYIDSREIGEPEPLTLESFQHLQTIEYVTFFQRDAMSTQVTLVNAEYNSSEQLILNWADGISDPYDSFAALKTDVDAWLANKENAKMLIRAGVVYRSEDGSDVTACNGAVCVLDGQASEIVILSGIAAP